MVSDRICTCGPGLELRLKTRLFQRANLKTFAREKERREKRAADGLFLMNTSIILFCNEVYFVALLQVQYYYTW